MNNTFLSSNNHTSGGDERFKTVIEDCKNMELDFLLLSNKDFINKMSKIKINFITSPAFFDFFNTYINYGLRTVWLTFKLFTFRNSIIITSSDQLPDTLPLIINRIFYNRNNLYMAMSYHLIPNPTKRSGNVINNLLSYFSQRLFFSFSKLLDAIIAPSQYYRDNLMSKRNLKSKVLVLPMKVNSSLIFQGDIENDKKFDCIYVGRIAPNKGINSIPIILSRKNTQTNITLVIVGSGKKKIIQGLKYQLIEKEVEFNFTGFVDDFTKIELYRSSKCLILPSKEEGFSLSISEALDVGIEVVAWDIPALRSIYGDVIHYARIDDTNDFLQKILDALTKEKRKNSIPSFRPLGYDEMEKDFYTYLAEK